MRSDLLEQRRYHAVERTRILALNYEHPPLGGGGGVAAANLCQELARRGHELDYVTSHWEGL